MFCTPLYYKSGAIVSALKNSAFLQTDIASFDFELVFFGASFREKNAVSGGSGGVCVESGAE